MGGIRVSEDKALVFDIGGVFELTMVEGAHGYHGHYTNKVNGITNSFSASGMTKKQIITRFWMRAKEFKGGAA
jgi:hypothetical protein